MLIADIQRFCMHDGPGVRTTVFFKGCSLDCAWCHNPETKSTRKELLYYENKCIGCGACLTCPRDVHKFVPHHIIDRNLCVGCGACVKNCPTDALQLVGEEYTPEELYKQIQKDIAFYGEEGGVTFSGGECMLQIEPLAEILVMCKANGIHTTIDTAGYVPYEYFEKILPYTDLFLYDIKSFDKEKHVMYVGVDNELILDNLKKLLKAGANIWIRVPIIPEVNDSETEMKSIKEFLDQWGVPEKVELLPYHPMGGNKYKALGEQPHTFQVPDPEKMKQLKEIFV